MMIIIVIINNINRFSKDVNKSSDNDANEPHSNNEKNI